jgi:hypothetical protein
MVPKIVEAEYVHNFVIHLLFAERTEGAVDLAQEPGGLVRIGNLLKNTQEKLDKGALMC